MFDLNFDFRQKSPIKVGLIFSTKGSNDKSEHTAQQAALFAIDEINRQGGILGRQLLPIIQDTQSDWKNTKESFEQLINSERVKIIFGSGNQWKTEELQQLLAKSGTLLITSSRYLGVSRSLNIIYMGITANQQVPITVEYCLNHIGKGVVLVGSQDATSLVINKLLRHFIQAQDATLQGDYILSGDAGEIEKVIKEIVDTKPKAILNTLPAGMLPIFFKKLKEAGIPPSKLTIFSLNLTQDDLIDMEIEDLAGSYATWNYFQTLQNEINQQFKKDFFNFSELRDIGDSAEAAYNSVHIWAKAVEETGHEDLSLIHNALRHLKILAPEGAVTINKEGDGAWKYSRIGKVSHDGQFEVVWQTEVPIPPFPFPLIPSTKFEKQSQNNERP